MKRINYDVFDILDLSDDVVQSSQEMEEHHVTAWSTPVSLVCVGTS